MTDLPPGFIAHAPGDPCPVSSRATIQTCSKRGTGIMTYTAGDLDWMRKSHAPYAYRPSLTVNELWSRIMELEAKLNEKEQHA